MNKPNDPFHHSPTLQIIHKGLRGLFWIGVLMLLTGCLALLFPVISTLAVNYSIGGLLMFAGSLQSYNAFSIRQSGPFFGALLLGLLSLAAGFYLVFNPLAGVVALTFILAILFIIEGTFHILLALEIKPHPAWGGMMFSGLVSAVLGLYVASGLTDLSMIVLGILLGINFLTTGIAFLYLYTRLKKITDS